ncbi:MAG: Spy/CpxP family protein refolding chaperone, partial [Pseudolabrys sp.]|nr:Spy/CpxP family protein refolding chaperone [Pseudolabrys sp.]
MNKPTNELLGWAAAALVAASLALPSAAYAQDPPKKPAPGKPAPAARPAPPAARPAPPPQAARPAPPAARPAPQVARPAAPPRPAPNFARPQRPAPRVAAPSRPVPNVSAPQRSGARSFDRRERTAAPAAATPAARIAAQPLSRAELRQQRADERRALRGVPRSQRAQRLEQFRAERAAQRQQNNPAAQTNTLRANTASPNALQASTPRRNGQARVSAQAAQQGRFAGRFAAQQNAGSNAAVARNIAFVAARSAWQQNRRAGFRAWYGPVFYPYAYSDIFDYAFWPGGYDDGYWDYAYDDFFDGVFYGTAPVSYAYGPETGAAIADRQPAYAAVQQLCKQPGEGVTAWPFAEIEKVGLRPDQQHLLDTLRASAKQAALDFASSCPAENAFPVTPPGRLAAMTARLQATLNAVKAVKPALD